MGLPLSLPSATQRFTALVKVADMGLYTTPFFLRHVLPDDRLVNIRVSDNERTGEHIVQFEYRKWYIDPGLFHDIHELSRHVSRSGALEFEPTLLGHKPLFDAWFEIVPAERLPLTDQPMAFRIGRDEGQRPYFQMLCRQGTIDPAMVRELNEYAMPYVCSGLVPVPPKTRGIPAI
jgi:hypothetical protein